MSIAQHPDKWWDWFMPEDEKKKKKIDPIFIEKLQKCVSVVYKLRRKIVYVFCYIRTKIYTRNCLKQFSACYIIQTNSVSILFVKCYNNLKYKPKIC